MRNLLTLLSVIFLSYSAQSQIEFQSVMYTDYEPGVEIGFEIRNISDEPINHIQIQLRRTLPSTTPSYGSQYFFDIPLAPGEIQWIYPFPYCVDAWPNFETEFEARIYNIDGATVQINFNCNQIWVAEGGCTTLFSTGPLQIFCEECGDPSNINEIIYSNNQNFSVNVYDLHGRLLFSHISPEEILSLPPNQFYILRVFNEKGYEVKKVTFTP